MDRRDTFELFEEEKFVLPSKEKTKRYNIPTGFWNLGFLDKDDKDFSLMYKGQDYRILSINKKTERKATPGKTQPVT